MPGWTVTLTYVGFAALLLIGALGWLVVLFEHVLHGRVELGLLDPGWLETARALRRLVRPALTAGLACGGLAFLLAVLPAAEGDALAQSHKAYQWRAGTILLLFLGLVWLSYGRMGAFDADIAAVLAFAWALWVTLAGWRAHAGEAVIAVPALWWLALTLDALAIAAFAALWIVLEIEGFRFF